ncbi:hypothetical protein L1987_49700 [Smallanthus sonchifolius]|uniref:Uncharacterized protein n=1 Tax=Smallanthus sonchifolius TaxID=185202 RepID=A0ACB9FW06_9ASTR|nr:hypothetical protein L1987_49700 [Smallanthus sonchifolius]
MLSSKRDNNSDSTTATTSRPSMEFATNYFALDRSSSGGVLENLVNSVDRFLREALQNPRLSAFIQTMRRPSDIERNP